MYASLRIISIFFGIHLDSRVGNEILRKSNSVKCGGGVAVRRSALRQISTHQKTMEWIKRERPVYLLPVYAQYIEWHGLWIINKDVKKKKWIGFPSPHPLAFWIDSDEVNNKKETISMKQVERIAFFFSSRSRSIEKVTNRFPNKRGSKDRSIRRKEAFF